MKGADLQYAGLNSYEFWYHALAKVRADHEDAKLNYRLGCRWAAEMGGELGCVTALEHQWVHEQLSRLYAYPKKTGLPPCGHCGWFVPWSDCVKDCKADRQDLRFVTHKYLTVVPQV